MAPKAKAKVAQKAKAAARGKAQAGCFLRALMDSKKLHLSPCSIQIKKNRGLKITAVEDRATFAVTIE